MNGWPKKWGAWKHVRVVATRDLRNGVTTVPKGRKGSVCVGGRGSVIVTFDACAACGCAPVVSFHGTLANPPEGVEPIDDTEHYP